MDTVIQCLTVSYMDLMMEIVVIRNMKTGIRDVVGMKNVIVFTKIIAISRIWKISAKMKLWWNSVTMIVEFLMMKFHLFGLCFWHMKHFSKNCTLWKFNTFPATQIILQFKAICFSQCGNFRIFLSFIIYVKSILGKLVLKCCFCQFLLIWYISAFKNCKSSWKSTFRASKCVKMAYFALLESQKNWFHVKSECSKNNEFSTLCFFFLSIGFLFSFLSAFQ